MTMISVNADIGEGVGAWTIADAIALLDVLTDANLACPSRRLGHLAIDRRVRRYCRAVIRPAPRVLCWICIERHRVAKALNDRDPAGALLRGRR